MSPARISRCILWIALFSAFALIVQGKGGRGGGRSRGGGSRGGSSSSRSSSSSYGKSSSSSGGGSSYNYGSSSSSSSGGGGSSHNYGSSSASSSGYSSKYGSSSGGSSSFKYPGSSSSVNVHSPFGGGSASHMPTNLGDLNAYLATERKRMHDALAAIRNSHTPSIANYPRQQFSHKPSISLGSTQQSSASQGILNANYPRQPVSFQSIPSHSSFPQSGIPNANYPRQPFLQQPLVPSGASTFQGIPLAYSPKKAMPLNPSPPLGHQPSRSTGPYSHPQSGISNANYPRQQYNYQSLPPQQLGSGVWNPKSGMPAPVYMNYGGLPTGANMYTKPMKKQGFLGSLMSVGGSSKSYKNKHYGSYPSPYGTGGGMPANVLGDFMGNKGSKTAMYTILPYKAARKSSKLFKPKFGFYSYRPIRYHSYHHHSYIHEPEYARMQYDVYNNDYVGRCHRPIKPHHAEVVCNSTHNQVDCDVSCEEGYRFHDNSTRKTNKCWHVSGTWNPTKNFPACKPVCDQPCLNGGKCINPGKCLCPSEYRGPRCELHFLNCDIRKLANGTKILWMCTHTKNGTTCKVRCKPPAEFVPQSESLYKCTPEGVWTPRTLAQCVMPSDAEENNVTEVPEEHIIKTTS